MDNLGSILKQKRVENGLSIEDVSKKTRLTFKHIRALEEGDMEYFKDDLSYLRYYVKAYCDALEIPFDEVKDHLNFLIQDYTMAFDKTISEKHESMEKNIRETSNKMQLTHKKGKKLKKSRHKQVDVSLLSFLAIVIVLLIALILAFVIWSNGNKKNHSNVIDEKPPVAVVPQQPQTQEPSDSTQQQLPQNQTDKKEEEKPQVKEFAIEKIDDTHFNLQNLNEDQEIDIEITFGSNSSFRALVNGEVLNDPQPKAYYPYKTILHVKEKAKKDKKIQLAFGFMQNNMIKINGKQLELDASLLNKQGSVILEFIVKGE